MSSLKKYLVLLLVLVLILSFGTAACNWDWLFGPKAPDDNDDDKDKEECEYPLEPPTGNIGDTIRSCHFEVEWQWALRTEGYNNEVFARDGEVLIVFYAKITLKKIKEETPWISCDCFKLQDGQGKSYPWKGTGASDMMQQVALNENQSTEGVVIIGVPKTASNLIAIFYPAQNSDIYKDQIKCNLGF